MSKKQWLAIARDALIRSGMPPFTADKKFPVDKEKREWAFHLLNHLENQVETGRVRL